MKRVFRVHFLVLRVSWGGKVLVFIPCLPAGLVRLGNLGLMLDGAVVF